MKTILITGCSTGIGLETAKYFSQKGWNVIATMRSPEKSAGLDGDNVLITKLDVSDSDSIKSTISQGIERFKKIDVLVNNAGYGLIGPFEAISDEEIRKQFEVNVFGLMNVTRELLPHMRENRSGTIINISSIGGKITLPYWSAYHSTKFAIEGFSDSLQYELSSFNIRVKLIEPGAINTDFYSRSMNVVNKPDIYTKAQTVIDRINSATIGSSGPSSVAKVIFRAANSKSSKLRYSAGRNAGLVILMRTLMPDWMFNGVIKILNI